MDRHRPSCEGGTASSSSESGENNNNSSSATRIQCSNTDFPLGPSQPSQGAPRAAVMPPGLLVDEPLLSSHSVSRTDQLIGCDDKGESSTGTHYGSVSLGGGRCEAAHVSVSTDDYLPRRIVPKPQVGGLEASAGGATSAVLADSAVTPCGGAPVSRSNGVETGNAVWAGARCGGNRDFLDLSANEDTAATVVGGSLAAGAEIFGRGAAAPAVAEDDNRAVYPVMSQAGERSTERCDHDDGHISREVCWANWL